MPGQVLREHRERLDLSMEDIATRTRLHINIIKAIEEDDYNNISSPLYIKGYLRSYAKIVGADAERVVGLYNASAKTELPEILPEVATPSQASGGDRPVKMFSYLVGFTLVLLLLIWHQNNFRVETVPAGQKQAVLPESTEIKGETAPAAPVEAPSQYIPEDTGVATPGQNEAGSISAENHGVETSQLESDDQTAPAVAAFDLIRLVFLHSSWVEIYDADEQRLFFNFAASGEEYLIEGKAPFRVLLGFAHGATVEFNGRPIDLAPYVKENIARFTLPES